MPFLAIMSWPRLIVGSITIMLLLQTLAYGQPVAPSRPSEYRVLLRYRIYAERNDRIAQFFEMIKYLESIGFKKDAGSEGEAENQNETRMSGTIVSENADRLLTEPHVKTVLLTPAAYQLPQEPTKAVQIQMLLTSGLSIRGQFVLADQVRAKLILLGFHEAIGYDNRGHKRMVGTIPASMLTDLLEDLRWQPAGWLTPATPVGELPTPLRSVSPIQVIEVMPTEPAKEASMPPPTDGSSSQKIGPELRALAGQEGKDKPVRMEIILNYHPTDADREWRQAIRRAAPDFVIESRLGASVIGLALPKSAIALAEVPTVSVVRLPPEAVHVYRSGHDKASDNGEALSESGVQKLHQKGYRGQQVRAAVIDNDFRGYELCRGKGLPLNTRYVDLTAERNPNLEPDAYIGTPSQIGTGTEYALGLCLAAPEVELTLIRVDAAAPHQLVAAARLIKGENFHSESYNQRSEQLLMEDTQLRRRRDELAAERRQFLETFGRDSDFEKRHADLLRKPEELEKDLQARQKALSEKESLLEAEVRAHQQRQLRFIHLEQELGRLRGISIVCCTLNWNDGLAVTGNGALSRYFNDEPFHGTLWFQSAGNTRGQAWSGAFHDEDGNGVMEFAGPDSVIRPGRWTRELNFLEWKPWGKKSIGDVPAKARVRVSLQWRESHDPDFFGNGEDVYQAPLANLRLVILRQRDPSGKTLPGDDLELVAQTTGLARRLDNEPGSASYEVAAEFIVDTPGRYAVRIEGQKPFGRRPRNTPTLPGKTKDWELWARLYAQVVDEPTRAAGQVVFTDYFTDLGTLGTPAEANKIFTVGAADLEGKDEAYSAAGPPMKREWLRKPLIRSYAGLAVVPQDQPGSFGADLACPFASGSVAAGISAGIPIGQFEAFFHSHPGTLVKFPLAFSKQAVLNE